MTSMPSGIWPAMRSVVIGAPPLYGMCVISIFSAAFVISPTMWPIEPGPPEPKVPNLPSSFSDAGPLFGLAMISTGATPSIDTCVNCLTGSYGCVGTVKGPIDVGVLLDSISV